MHLTSPDLWALLADAAFALVIASYQLDLENKGYKPLTAFAITGVLASWLITSVWLSLRTGWGIFFSPFIFVAGLTLVVIIMAISLKLIKRIIH